MTDQALKRISLLIREDQYTELNGRGLNLSGLVRDLIDDHLSAYKITLSVSEATRNLYDRIVANTGSTDADVEIHLKDALGKMLESKITEMQALQKSSFGKDAKGGGRK